MSNALKKVGMLLVGHGTRDEVGTRQFLELAEGLKEAFALLAVEAAFLELAQPGIGAGVERLLGRGVNEIVTAPVILFSAGHVKRDIPGQVAASLAARGRGEVRQTQVGHLGSHEAIVELSRLRMEEAVRGQAAKETETLLLVARGSSDEEAAEEMRRFAAMRQAELPGMQVEVAFLAKARPSLEEQLDHLATFNYERVTVQPHFLFEGELVERIRGQIAGMALVRPQTEWIITQPLADPPGKPGLARELLAKVIRDRLREAGFVLS